MDGRRRRGRVAEGGGLLNRYRVSSPIKGSNPFVSASLRLRQNPLPREIGLQPPIRQPLRRLLRRRRSFENGGGSKSGASPGEDLKCERDSRELDYLCTSPACSCTRAASISTMVVVVGWTHRGGAPRRAFGQPLTILVTAAALFAAPRAQSLVEQQRYLSFSVGLESTSCRARSRQTS
jgi:hypothetical protein